MSSFGSVSRLPGPPSSPLARWFAAARVHALDVRKQFLVFVALPTALAAVYYGAVASDLYVSHVEYLVRGTNTHQGGGLNALLNNIGLSRAADDASAVESFVQSRSAIEKLDSQVDLRAAFSPPGADFLARFPRPWQSGTFEELYAHLQSFIKITQDQTTGITTLEVRAFRAADAQRIASSLLGLAEDMVNGMNKRAQADAVSVAQNELDAAHDEIVKTEADLTKFRNDELLIDPQESARLLLEGIGDLSLERANAQAAMDEKSSLSADSPGLQSLRAKTDALAKRIEEERTKLAGDDAALSGKVSIYERLTLLRDLADKRFTNALATLRSAQLEAQSRQVYIEEMVPPNLPDTPIEPERLRMVLTVFTVSFAIFAVFWIITVGSKEHSQ